jgi:hypothetical protein
MLPMIAPKNPTKINGQLEANNSAGCSKPKLKTTIHTKVSNSNHFDKYWNLVVVGAEVMRTVKVRRKNVPHLIAATHDGNLFVDLIRSENK